MRNYIRKNWDKITLFILSILLVLPLFKPGYFSHHDDLHVIRIFEMRKCLMDFQIPCRWVPDMGYGYGFPLFNYYNPLPYYIGAVSSFFVGYINSAKLLFLIPLLFAGYTMYLFVGVFGNKKAALLSGVLYAFAPYRSVDAYVRGAIGESFSLLIAPLVFYFSYKLLKESKIKNIVGLSLSLAAFLTSHNVSVIIWGPVIFIWFLALLILKNFKNVKLFILALVLGVGISSFFTIPAFLEKNLISTDGLTSYALDYRNHFVSYKQLFFQKSWGYGASVFGRNDGLSFQVGFPHWILGGLSIVCLLLFFKKVKNEKKFSIMFFFGVFVFSVLMTHVRSAFIWENFKTMSFIQFPWRYLSLSIFSVSILGGLMIDFLKERLSKTLLVLLIPITIFLNFSYFRPEKYVLDMTDAKKLSEKELQNQKEGSILDYLPKTAKKPQSHASEKPFEAKGLTNFSAYTKNSNSWHFKSESASDVKVTLPIFEFPNWKITDNGRRIEHGSDIDGYITINIGKGDHYIEGKFVDTPIRKLSNLITILSAGILIFFIHYGKSRKVFK